MSWLLWLVGRRYEHELSLYRRHVLRVRPNYNRLMVRLWWWSEWQPVRLVKVAGPVYMTDEVLRRYREGGL